MSIVDEINKDLAELGEAGGETIEEAMDKLGDEIVKTKGEADANKLPEVTAEDEGKVLMVDSEGKWGADDVSVAKIYDVQYNSGRYNLPSGVKSKDIYAECESGVNVILKDQNNLLYKYIGMNSGYHVFNLVYLDLSSSKIYVKTIWAENNNNTYLLSDQKEIARV